MLSDAQKRRNERNLESLHPDVRELARRHLELCASEGIDLLVVQAYRGMEQQAALYAKGRSAPGKIVTNARPGYSWHNFGRAYDVAVIEDGKLLWDGPKYARPGAIGKELGLAWGGDFRSVRGDLGHFEYHPGLTLAQMRVQSGLT